MSYNGAQFKALVATHLNRSDLTSLIATFCALAVQKLERECLWFQLTSSTLSTTVAVKYVALPTDFVREIKDGVRDTSGYPLVKETWEQIDYWQRRNADTGEPDYYAIADKFYFYPIPNTTYALPIQYHKSLGFPGDSVSNAWTNEAWDLTLWATLEEAWLYLNNQEEMTKAQTQKWQRLAEIRSLSGKHTGTGQIVYRDW